MEFMPGFYCSGASPTERLVFSALAPSVFLLNLSVHLSVKDLLALRRTCKKFYHLTFQPEIWERFIRSRWARHLTYPIIPPSSSSRNVLLRSARHSGTEVERLLSSAITLSENTRNGFSQVFGRSHFSVQSKQTIFEVKLIAGGKYMFLSVGSRASYGILCYAMDYPHGSRLIAEMPTKTRAFHITAEYQTHDRVPCISLVYSMRHYVDDKISPTLVEDLAKLAPDADTGSELPIRYTVMVHKIPLLSLSDSERCDVSEGAYNHLDVSKKPVFDLILEIQLSNAIYGGFTLSHFSPVSPPYLGFIKRPNTIYIVNLVTGQLHLANCESHPFSSRLHKSLVHAVYLLPEQSHILALRSFNDVVHDRKLMIELLPLEYHWDSRPTILHSVLQVDVIPSSVVISGGPSYFQELFPFTPCPPRFSPLNIAVIGRQSEECSQTSLSTFLITPVQMNGLFIYELTRKNGISESEGCISPARTVSITAGDVRSHAIGGEHFHLVYCSLADDRRAISATTTAFFIRARLPSATERGLGATAISYLLGRPLARLVWTSDVAPVFLPPDILSACKKGVASVTWDDSVARLCIATCTDVYVLNFSKNSRVPRLPEDPLQVFA
ncbi:hypothetical protein FISHEDRAFT_77516 [Fistulina hepatica ATCC 64428]|uniref:F-box domain-containing protein n=1 Tax=Fistulina hepatica ATCC 64428 TaxID=1128425 RepID=A0A0D7A0K8_9AGAR|nr:hypothetical protein FISHEDRAFT_77516 [Fistulina hepatica ATCC 64428]